MNFSNETVDMFIKDDYYPKSFDGEIIANQTGSLSLECKNITYHLNKFGYIKLDDTYSYTSNATEDNS